MSDNPITKKITRHVHGYWPTEEIANEIPVKR